MSSYLWRVWMSRKGDILGKGESDNGTMHNKIILQS